jgi:hypothetical protein
MATFQTSHAASRAALDQFVITTFDAEDVTEQEELDAVENIVTAAGCAVLGIWEELHRIANSLESMAQK